MNVEEEILKAISAGESDKLEPLLASCLSCSDRFETVRHVKVFPKSGTGPFKEIFNPSPLIYTILCEQSDILYKMLMTKNLNPYERLNGWTALHYACATARYKCLYELLKFEIVHKFIDIPIIGVSPSHEGWATTSLHVCATNRRYAQALLLTFFVPQFLVQLDGTPVASLGPEAEPNAYPPANPLQLSNSGITPLHIAVFNNDLEMVKILWLTIGKSAPSCQNETPLDYAKKMNRTEILEYLQKVESEPVPEDSRTKQLIEFGKKYLGDVLDEIKHNCCGPVNWSFE